MVNCVVFWARTSCTYQQILILATEINSSTPSRIVPTCRNTASLSARRQASGTSIISRERHDHGDDIDRSGASSPTAFLDSVGCCCHQDGGVLGSELITSLTLILVIRSERHHCLCLLSVFTLDHDIFIVFIPCLPLERAACYSFTTASYRHFPKTSLGKLLVESSLQVVADLISSRRLPRRHSLHLRLMMIGHGDGNLEALLPNLVDSSNDALIVVRSGLLTF